MASQLQGIRLRKGESIDSQPFKLAGFPGWKMRYIPAGSNSSTDGFRSFFLVANGYGHRFIEGGRLLPNWLADGELPRTFSKCADRPPVLYTRAAARRICSSGQGRVALASMTCFVFAFADECTALYGRFLYSVQLNPLPAWQGQWVWSSMILL